MARFDSKMPIRSLAADNETRIANSSNTVIDPATEATLASILTAVQIMDDWDDGADRANVNIQTNAAINLAQVAGTATSVNTGNADAGTQRVVLATDQPTIPVSITGAGGQLTAFKRATAIAAAGTDDHTLAGAAGRIIQGVVLSASGQAFADIKWGLATSEVLGASITVDKGNLTATIMFPDGISLPAGDNMIVTVTNEEPGQAHDIDTTILYTD